MFSITMQGKIIFLVYSIGFSNLVTISDKNYIDISNNQSGNKARFLSKIVSNQGPKLQLSHSCHACCLYL